LIRVNSARAVDFFIWLNIYQKFLSFGFDLSVGATFLACGLSALCDWPFKNRIKFQFVSFEFFGRMSVINGRETRVEGSSWNW
jgi:hypothetical protein